MNTDQKIGKVLGDLESDIMEVVWHSPNPISVRDVTENLLHKRKIAYTTVMTIMGRLTEKGLLKRTQLNKAYIYQPIYSKDKFLTKVSRQIIKNFISSFGDGAVAHFASELEKIPVKQKTKLIKILKGQNE